LDVLGRDARRHLRGIHEIPAHGVEGIDDLLAVARSDDLFEVLTAVEEFIDEMLVAAAAGLGVQHALDVLDAFRPGARIFE